MKQDLKVLISNIEKAEKDSEYYKTNSLGTENLNKYLNKINRGIGNFDAVLFYIEPRGKNGRNFEEEFSLFLKKIDKDSEYSPTFTYPQIAKIKITNINKIIVKLKKIREEIKLKENDNSIKNIVFEALDIAEAKINFLKELKKKNYEKAFKYSKIIYGEVDDNMCKMANEIYKKNIKLLVKRKKKNDLEKKMKELSFNAEKIKSYFELALTMADLNSDGYRVVVDDSVPGIKVSEKNPKYSFPVILIPAGRKVNGKELLRLIAHEIGRHVSTNIYSKKQGLVSEIGKDWDVFNEGIAKKSENDVEKTIFGSSFFEFPYSFSIYYILAIEKIKKGFNFNGVYKFILELRRREKKMEYKYFDLEKKCKKSNFTNKQLKNKLKDLRETIDNESIEFSKKICLRVFRGFDPKKGFMYFPKDKVYFEGEIKTLEMSKLKSVDKLEKYLRLAKADPKLVPFLIKIGVYKYDKNLNKAKNVAIIMWQNKKIRNCILEGKIYKLKK